MFNPKYYCGLDVGAQYLRGVVLKVEAKTIEMIESYATPVYGFKEGNVSDLNELTECIHKVINTLSQKTGVKLKEIQLGINGEFIEGRYAHAMIPLVDKGNKVIVSSDMKKLNEQAKLLGVQIDEDVLHDIPQSYEIDGNSKVSSPRGLSGRKLGVKSLMIIAKSGSVQNISKAVHQAGYDVTNISFSSYAAIDVVLEEQQYLRGCALVDIGAAGISVLIFKEGKLQYLDQIKFGGNNFTQSIAHRLKISFDLAEDIKKTYANVLSISPYHKEEVLVKKDQSYIPIKREVIDQSIEPEMIYMIKKIQESIVNSGLQSQMNDGLIMVGGGSFLPGLIERIGRETGFSARLGGLNIKHSLDVEEGVLFGSAVGLAQNGFKKVLCFKNEICGSWWKRTTERMKEVYEEYF